VWTKTQRRPCDGLCWRSPSKTRDKTDLYFAAGLSQPYTPGPQMSCRNRAGGWVYKRLLRFLNCFSLHIHDRVLPKDVIDFCMCGPKYEGRGQMCCSAEGVLRKQKLKSE
jgi:hypothetical protein